MLLFALVICYLHWPRLQLVHLWLCWLVGTKLLYSVQHQTISLVLHSIVKPSKRLCHPSCSNSVARIGYKFSLLFSILYLNLIQKYETTKQSSTAKCPAFIEEVSDDVGSDKKGVKQRNASHEFDEEWFVQHCRQVSNTIIVDIVITV